MRPIVGQVIELGRIDAARGTVQVTLRPIGEAWVVWVRWETPRTRRHIGVMSISPTGYVFTPKRGERVVAEDWRALIQEVVARSC